MKRATLTLLLLHALATCTARPDATLHRAHRAPHATRRHYRAVVLVLSSHLTPLVRNCRTVWQAYMNHSPDIKVFLVYGSSATFAPQSYDLVYPDIGETYSPGMLLKTVAAMEHIDATLSYDYFVRTNIGTFWNFTALLEHLDDLPSALTYSGDGPFRHEYVSGTDTMQ